MDDRLLAAQLLQRGWIDPQVLAQVQGRLQPGQPLAQALVAQRLISPQALATLGVGLSAAPATGSGRRPGSRRFPSTQPGTSRFPGQGSRSGTGRHVPAVGEVVADRYRVTGELGKGGMGVVLAAVEVGTERRVAVKMLLPGKTSATHVKRFEREAQVAARLEHAGVVPVHASGEHQGCPYYVMEFVEGRDLGQLFAGAQLQLDRVVELVEDVCRTLAACHEAGILHRDLKPPNVMVRQRDGRALVADFGLAREDSSERLTRTGQFLGTPGYMALEQLQDSKHSDHRADIYSLGAILFHGLAGEPPFRGETLEQLFQAFAEDPPKPSSRREGVPKALDQVCAKAMARHPEDRYQTAAALADDLARWRAGEAVGASRGSALFTFGRRLRRRDRRAVIPAIALAGALLVVLVSGGVYALWVLPGQRARAGLDAFRGFDAQVLAPWALGLGEGPAPDAAALGEWAERLQVASERLDGAPRAAASAELARVEAHRRLLQHQAGVEVDVPVRERADRGTTDLLVDALVWLDRGRPQRAMARVAEAAERSDPPAALGRVRALLWEAVLRDERADEAAQEFFVYLQRLESEGREAELRVARTQARQAIVERVLGILRAAPTQPRDQTRADLDRVLEHAGDPALGLTPAALGELLSQPKVAALEAAAPAWDAALRAGEAEGGGHARLDPVHHLGLLTRSAPAVAPGPALRAVLDGAVARAVEAYARAEGDAQRDAALGAIALESTIFYDVDPTHVQTSTGYKQLVLQVVNVDSYGKYVNTDAVLAQLRTDPQRQVWETFLVQRFDPADVVQKLEGRPTSQALVYCLLMLVRRSATQGGELAQLHDLDALTARLEAVLVDGIPDLRHNYLANAWVTVGKLLLQRLGAQPAEARPAVGARIHAALGAARPLATDPLVLCRLLETEAQTVGALEGQAAEAQAWERAVEAYHEGERALRDDPVATDWDSWRAELLTTRAQRLGRSRLPGLASRVIDEAVEATQAHWPDERALPELIRFASYALLDRRPEQAEALVAPRLEAGLRDPTFALLAVQAALATQQRAEGEARLARALAQHPDDAQLLRLQERLREGR